MIREQLNLDPHDRNPGTGVGGRMLDILKRNGHQTSGNTVDGISPLTIGDSYYNNAPSTVTSGSLDRIDKYSSLSKETMLDLVKKINGEASANNSMFGETWAQRVSEVLFEYKTGLAIHEAIVNGEFDMGNYRAGDSTGEQLKSVARYMKSRHLRKVDREVYVVHQPGFDMHESHATLPSKFGEANGALSTFIEYLKRENLWDDTIILMGSDFGRSVAPNSNGGSDHAWGGKFNSFPVTICKNNYTVGSNLISYK